MVRNVWRSMSGWFKTKVVEPVGLWLREGAEPPILARSAAVGAALGLCPLLGVSTLMCVAVLFPLKLANVQMHPAMCLLANLISIPIEVAMILPHMRIGEWLLGADPLPVLEIHVSDLWKGHLGTDLLKAFGHAMLGWVVLMPLVLLGITLATTPLFDCLKRRYGAAGRRGSSSSAGLQVELKESSDLSDEEEPLASAPFLPLISSAGGLYSREEYNLGAANSSIFLDDPHEADEAPMQFPRDTKFGSSPLSFSCAV